jgi:hypothetical protein
LNVKNRAEAVATLRHIHVSFMETLARWVPTTPEMEVKILFGRHLWLCAQLADRLGKRTRELRAPLHHSRPPPAEYAGALAGLAGVSSTSDRVEAFYAVALPSVARACDDYVARTDAVIDEPTVVILADALRDIARMREEARKLAAEFPALAKGSVPPAVSSGFASAPVAAESEAASA